MISVRISNGSAYSKYKHNIVSQTQTRKVNRMVDLSMKITAHCYLAVKRGFSITWADPGISKHGQGPGAVEFLDLRFALMPLHTYPMILLEE